MMKTKHVLLAAAAAFLSLTAGAQSATNPLLAKTATAKPVFYHENDLAVNLGNYNPEKYRKFKKMRTAGIVLTAVGAGLMGGGVALINSAENSNDYWYDDNEDEKAVAGVLCILLGVPSIGGGVTMWAIGNNKMKKYGGGVSLNANPGRLTLAYRF